MLLTYCLVVNAATVEGIGPAPEEHLLATIKLGGDAAFACKHQGVAHESVCKLKCGASQCWDDPAQKSKPLVSCRLSFCKSSWLSRWLLRQKHFAIGLDMMLKGLPLSFFRLVEHSDNAPRLQGRPVRSLRDARRITRKL